MNLFLNKYPLFLLLIFTFSCAQEKPETSIDLKEGTKSKKLFSKLSAQESGVHFKNVNQESNSLNFFTYEYFYNGGGVASADFNNDGLDEIIFTANMGPNVIYLNKGDLKFQDISKISNLNSGESDWCTGLNVIDINKDGYLDVMISRSGWFSGKEQSKLRNLLFINNGDLTFTERGLEYGFTDFSRTTQSCFFDMDNDGDLDVYFLNHPAYFKRDKYEGLADVKDENNNFVDRIYENKGNKFFDVTKKLNIGSSGHGLGVISADFNNDGWQDIYVSNDYLAPDCLYINQKDGSFKEERNNALKHMSKFSMGLDVADINNDGLQDIFTSEMLAKDNYSKKVNMASMDPSIYWNTLANEGHHQNMFNSLQLNNGDNTFSEISWLAGIAETGWTWSPIFADFDNDGNKDLFVSNGYKRDVLNKDFTNTVKENFNKEKVKFKELESFIPETKLSNYIYRNNGDLTFDDKTKDWNIDLPMNSNGAIASDLDNDGDLDIVVNNINEIAVIFENNLNADSNYIDIQLIKNGSAAYGAKIEILDYNQYQMMELTNVHGYQSVSNTNIHFGLGLKAKIDSLLITWPDSRKTLLSDVTINELTKVKYENSQFLDFKQKQKKKLFEKVNQSELGVSFVHQENDFDDYKREVLLPHKLSQEGPFIGVADVNGDGLDDFFVGNGSGYSGKLYLQTNAGTFKTSFQPDIEKDKLCEDLGVLFFDYDNDGDKDLYVVSGSNEFDLHSVYMQDRLYENDGKGNFKKTNNKLPKMMASGSCVKSFDFDKDGDLDLFVGGFQIPGKYPSAGESFLLLNSNGVFKDVTDSVSSTLKNIGMVKDALFTDVNNDGEIDLIVTGHWMPIEIFINENGKFINRSKEFGTKENVGWFNCILQKDINGDGYIDVVAGNLGTNTKHKASLLEPFKIFADDFDGNGTHDIVLGYYNEGICYPVRGKQCSSEQIPTINEEISSYDQFGISNIFKIYGKENLEQSVHYDATYFKTCYLLNQNGSSFSFFDLPNSVQFAPTNKFVSIRNESKWHNDLLLCAGNFYPVEIETGRYDAHIGNVFELKDEPIEYKSSGFKIDSDVRDIKVIKVQNKDFLIISSNRESLNFYLEK